MCSAPFSDYLSIALMIQVHPQANSASWLDNQLPRKSLIILNISSFV